MNEAEKIELLLELKGDVKHLLEEWKKVSNGVGFPRCAERGEKIKSLQDNYRWLRNTFFGGATVSGILTIAVAVFAYVTKS